MKRTAKQTKKRRWRISQTRTPPVKLYVDSTIYHLAETWISSLETGNRKPISRKRFQQLIDGLAERLQKEAEDFVCEEMDLA